MKQTRSLVKQSSNVKQIQLPWKAVHIYVFVVIVDLFSFCELQQCMVTVCFVLSKFVLSKVRDEGEKHYVSFCLFEGDM